ncbi:UNKNOWN [Stylonychia lemnae]|uniref:Uncharacterized protein n=1 Tax=Stylonychia lemnae TaxID=5949 RepID=A0A078AJ71_STYLE|nr:UNKNOWN [Stylonychia lemnae]|eukprot:CDW81527.1 UNKNOWN [Stylonychia lemnae]
MQKSLIFLIALLGLAAASTPSYNVKTRKEIINERFYESHGRIQQRALKSGRVIRATSKGLTGCDNGAFCFAQGLAYGLQFSQYKPSTCYVALTTSITSSEEIITKFWKIFVPMYMASHLQLLQDNTSAVSAIGCNCNVQGLVDFVTKALAEGISSTLASLGGALLFELGPLTATITSPSATDLKRGIASGKLVSICTRWYV